MILPISQSGRVHVRKGLIKIIEVKINRFAMATSLLHGLLKWVRKFHEGTSSQVELNTSTPNSWFLEAACLFTSHKLNHW